MNSSVMETAETITSSDAFLFAIILVAVVIGVAFCIWFDGRLRTSTRHEDTTDRVSNETPESVTYSIQSKVSPPPLPARRRSPSTPAMPSRAPRPIAVVESRSLPARRQNTRLITPPNNNRGYRGLRPDQFPCCPYDKLRNRTGSEQVIFWDSNNSCYCCSRGHRFRANGKIL